MQEFYVIVFFTFLIILKNLNSEPHTHTQTVHLVKDMQAG